jgi:hypothetical protein
MSDIHRLAEHEWTASYDAVDARRLTPLHGIFRHAAVAERAVEPDSPHATFLALLHELEGDIRMGRDDHAIDAARYRGQIWEAALALDL